MPKTIPEVKPFAPKVPWYRKSFVVRPEPTMYKQTVINELWSNRQISKSGKLYLSPRRRMQSPTVIAEPEEVIQLSSDTEDEDALLSSAVCDSPPPQVLQEATSPLPAVSSPVLPPSPHTPEQPMRAPKLSPPSAPKKRRMHSRAFRQRELRGLLDLSPYWKVKDQMQEEDE